MIAIRKALGLMKFTLSLALPAMALVTGCKSAEPITVEPHRVLVWATISTEVGVSEWYSGVAKSADEQSVSFLVPGRVTAIAREGDLSTDVGAIAKIDNQDYLLAIDSAEATLLQAEAAQRNANTYYTAVQELYANGNASLTELNAARASSDAADATAISAQKGVQLAKNRAGYTSLAFPDPSCVVQETTTDVNENVAAGQVVAKIACGPDIEVKFTYPVGRTALAEGEMAEVRFSSYGDQPFAAKINRIGLIASAGGAVSVTVRLDKPEREIVPGMVARVRLLGRQDVAAKVVVALIRAVDKVGTQNFVWLYRPIDATKGTVHKTVVTVGELNDKGIEILSGLKEGDLIVILGMAGLHDGDEVWLSEATVKLVDLALPYTLVPDLVASE